MIVVEKQWKLVVHNPVGHIFACFLNAIAYTFSLISVVDQRFYEKIILKLCASYLQALPVK